MLTTEEYSLIMEGVDFRIEKLKKEIARLKKELEKIKNKK